MTPHASLPDVVTLAVALVAAVVGPGVMADLVGPYAVILLGAVIGAAWSATRRRPDGAEDAPPPRGATVAYMLLVIGLALLLTVPAAEFAARYLGLESRWVLGPVAAIIGGIGRDWPGVGAWFLGILRSVIERWSRDAPPPGGGQR